MAAKPKKIGTAKMTAALTHWHDVTLAMLEDMPIDLSVRQQAILLHVYLKRGPHSVKNLAENLLISKPAVCRALDVLEQEKLLKRTANKKDSRSVLIQHTTKGEKFLQELGDVIAASS